MKRTVFCIAFTLFLTLVCRNLFAMPANPLPLEVSQPDGKAVRIYIRGDEWFHWYEDTDGYTVVYDNGRYAYGQLDKDNRLVATPLSVGVDDPKAAGLKKKTLPPISMRRSTNPSFLSGSGESSAPPAMVPPSGTVKNLVVLCKFSDHTFGVHTRDAGDYDILFNQVGGDPILAPTGSVKDLYIENSYNTMTLQSTVAVWVTLPNTEAYYANGQDGLGSYPRNAQKMVEDALNLVDPLVDFSQFDNDLDGYVDAIDIIHSGYGSETGGGGGNWIWSHRWVTHSIWTSAEGVKVWNYHTEPALWGTSGTNIVRFGVIAHETGHFFGLPDLYDTDGSGEGIGSWCMMANSWGFDSTQLHPPHFSAWSKAQLGWVTPTVISTPGTYVIEQVETNPQVYRVNYGYPSNEYLLIENRQPAGIESAMPQGGLCIYHIDDLAGYDTEGYPGQTGWPTNGKHYRVALLQADGSYNLEKGNNRGDRYDVYHAAGVSQIGTGPGIYPNTDAYQGGNIIVTGNALRSISAAGESMSFEYGNSHPPVAINVNTSTPLNTPVTITLSATDEGLPNPPGVLSYIITSLPTNGSLSDPNAGGITTVPYTVTGNGSRVVYTPTTDYIGPDNFTFKANDGGVPPDGGDSNLANVSITVTPSGPTVFLTEGFESAFVSGAPVGWTKAFKTGTVDWTRNVGDSRSGDTAHGGTYNAMLYYAGTGNHETYLITPVINFGTGTTDATLEFWHKQVRWPPSQDTLKVYYKTSAGGSWTPLASYTTNVPNWTKRTISLPNPGSTYYIGFLGNAKYGYGVCIDDVNVTGVVPTKHIISGHVREQDGVTAIGGVLMQADNNDINSITDIYGYYELLVDNGWSGRVTPTKYAYGFEPNGRTYTNVVADQTEQNYSGKLLTYVISGYVRNQCGVPIKDVVLTASTGGGSDVTDANGYYEVWVDYNWSGTVTPTKEHHTFDPAEMAYVDVLADQAEQNYQAFNIYDLDCNGSIGFGDLRIMSENWLNGPDLPGDFYKDEDNVVNFLDFADFANHWFEGP